ncbi:MAG: lysophospholipid acyltransferase family protein [Phycisphaerales bacterium]|nr:lysophospholipid acyltransferase family protein [Phycisphaerales bacterium]
MARNQPAWVNWSQYVVARVAAGSLGILDTPTVLRGAGSAASALHRLDRRHRERAEANVAQCFPDWPADRVADVAEASMRFLFQLAVEILAAPRLINADSWQDHVALGDIEQPMRRIVERKPMILLTGHCGNWEIFGWVMSLLGIRMHALARPLDNPLIWRWFAGIREQRGMKLVTKWGAGPDMIRIIKSGGLIGVIADQNAGDRGLFVPFFNRLASSYKSISLLAMRYDVPIACGQAVRVTDDPRYEFRLTDYIEPSDWADQEDPVFYITARYNKAMEMMVRSAPEQYLWMHRRWKSRPKFERQGRPMPESLRRKIASLPWMDDRTLERIEADCERGAKRAE